YFGLSNLIMVYLLGVVAVAARGGRGPPLFAAGSSGAPFDFFFVPPYFSFPGSDTPYMVTFPVVLIVALLISGPPPRLPSPPAPRRPRGAPVSGGPPRSMP